MKPTLAKKIGVLAGLFYTSCALAGNMGPSMPSMATLHPVASIFGGIANIDTQHTQTFIGVDSERYTYNNQGSTNGATFIGGFLGIAPELPYTNFFIQTGVEYTAFTRVLVRGQHTVGIEPATSTFYHYEYRAQTQQVLASAKLFAISDLFNLPHHTFYPYVVVGLGAAFNQASQYIATAQETGSINLTPTFADKTQTNFSYNVGVGVDTTIDKHVRFGLGYRFSDFGKLALSNGQVAVNNTTSPTGFGLNVPHVYANQFLAQVTYTA